LPSDPPAVLDVTAMSPPTDFGSARFFPGPTDCDKSDAPAWARNLLLMGERGLLLASVDGFRAAAGGDRSFDDPMAAIAFDRRNPNVGLRIYRDGHGQNLSQQSHGDRLRGGVVFDVAPDVDGRRKWVAGDGGLALLDAEDHVVKTFDRADGLPGNRMTGAAALDGRMYFSSAWGDTAGGLVVFDPRTSVFTGRFVADGLASNKIGVIETVDGRLKLVYSWEYGRGGKFMYRRFPPGHFDPTSAQIQGGGGATICDDRVMRPPRHIGAHHPKLPAAAPLLGGRILCERRFGSKRYICSTSGLAIVSDGASTEIAVEKLSVRLIVDPTERLIRAAEAAQVSVETPAALRTALKAENAYLRAHALAEVFRAAGGRLQTYEEVLAEAVNDPHPLPRGMAVFLLSRIAGESVVPSLEKARDDRDPYLRALAMAALMERGHLPRENEIAWLLDEQFGNFPFDVCGSIGVVVTRERVYQALAPHADAALFRLLLSAPPRKVFRDADGLFAALGASLRKHPDTVAVLLPAYDEDYRTAQVDFARDVFAAAGPTILPALYEGLRSQDRVVRSNAARGCGAIGDPVAIPRLIAALDLESGLARASIVWALGELKAKESLKQLATLYVAARNDEQRERNGGYRFAQAVAQFDSHMTAFRDLTAIGAEWDELKLKDLAHPIDPRRHEKLLQPQMILETVRKIGPEYSQEFYRVLAGDHDAGVRQEAAVCLAECDRKQRVQNARVLHNLLADTTSDVRVAAAVSLLIFGEEEMEKPLLAAILEGELWQRRAAARQLLRIQDGRQLLFARRALEALGSESAVFYDPNFESVLNSLLRRIPQ
jgi:HEAT repeat protein